MARTLCAGISNQAKDQFYRDNQDIIPQVEWLDTLDGRTCPSCAGLSRQRYNTEDPHPVPPLHPQCRCVLIPVTELTDIGEDVPRAAANADFDAEAKRLYEAKYPQKHFEDLAPSTREQYRHKAIHEYEERTGKPAFTRAPGSMTFADFFEQSSEQFKKDWLKPGKYALYKSGKYPITAFIPPHPDRAFGVKQLKEMDIESFKGVKWVKDKLNSFIKKDNLSFDLKDLQQIEDQAKKIVGTEEISFKGISDVSILNRINRVLHEIKQKYPYFYLYSIETVDNLIDNVPAAINGFNQMFLNAPYINHMLENYKQFQVVEGKYINPAGAMYYNKEIETIIYHEAGHAIYNIKVNDPKGYDKTNSNSKIKRHKLAVLKQMYRKSKQNGYAETVSKYAPVSEREFFSEIFAAVNLDKNAIPDYIKEGIKEILR